MLPTTNFFIDAPNVDFVLGDILGRRPSSHERPRWDAIKHNLSRTFSIAGRPNFVLNRRHFTDRLFPLARAIRSSGYHVQVVEARNCEILDLEHDLGGFNLRLPRPYRPD